MYINKATFDIDLTMGNIHVSTCIQLGHTDTLINDQSKVGPVPHDMLAFNSKLVTSSLWVQMVFVGPLNPNAFTGPTKQLSYYSYVYKFLHMLDIHTKVV